MRPPMLDPERDLTAAPPETLAKALLHRIACESTVRDGADRNRPAPETDPRDVRPLIVGETPSPVHLIADDLYRSWEGTIG